eukprot:ANDGO_02452.mRNA.1 hypothetical protein
MSDFNGSESSDSMYKSAMSFDPPPPLPLPVPVPVPLSDLRNQVGVHEAETVVVNVEGVDDSDEDDDAYRVPKLASSQYVPASPGSPLADHASHYSSGSFSGPVSATTVALDLSVRYELQPLSRHSPPLGTRFPLLPNHPSEAIPTDALGNRRAGVVDARSAKEDGDGMETENRYENGSRDAQTRQHAVHNMRSPVYSPSEIRSVSNEPVFAAPGPGALGLPNHAWFRRLRNSASCRDVLSAVSLLSISALCFVFAVFSGSLALRIVFAIAGAVVMIPVAKFGYDQITSFSRRRGYAYDQTLLSSSDEESEPGGF